MGRFLVVGAGKKKKNLLQNVCTCGDSRLLQLDNNLQVGNKKSPSLSLSLSLSLSQWSKFYPTVQIDETYPLSQIKKEDQD
jgi:hypothetical protein